MFGFLLAILILDGIFLMVIILLQAGKGGGLAAMGGAGTSSDSVIGGRHAANLLTKTTWAAGALFLGLAVVLTIMSSGTGGGPDSILQGEFQQESGTAPQPLLPGADEGGAEGTPATPSEGGGQEGGGLPELPTQQ